MLYFLLRVHHRMTSALEQGSQREYVDDTAQWHLQPSNGTNNSVSRPVYGSGCGESTVKRACNIFRSSTAQRFSNYTGSLE